MIRVSETTLKVLGGAADPVIGLHSKAVPILLDRNGTLPIIMQLPVCSGTVAG